MAPLSRTSHVYQMGSGVTWCQIVTVSKTKLKIDMGFSFHILAMTNVFIIYNDSFNDFQLTDVHQYLHWRMAHLTHFLHILTIMWHITVILVTRCQIRRRVSLSHADKMVHGHKKPYNLVNVSIHIIYIFQHMTLWSM